MGLTLDQDKLIVAWGGINYRKHSDNFIKVMMDVIVLMYGNKKFVQIYVCHKVVLKYHLLKIN